MKKIEQVDQFEQLLIKDEPFFFLKHSLTCPISASAYKEFSQFAENNEEISTYYLAVQESRELSTHIANQHEVRHESPQAFLFKNGKAVWHASHNQIKEQTFKDQLEQ